MPDFTDDDVAAACEAAAAANPDRVTERVIRAALAAVAPAIAARAVGPVLDELLDCVRQACEDSDGVLDSMALSSYAGAMRLLAEHGRIAITDEYGRRVIGRAGQVSGDE